MSRNKSYNNQPDNADKWFSSDSDNAAQGSATANNNKHANNNKNSNNNVLLLCAKLSTVFGTVIELEGIFARVQIVSRSMGSMRRQLL